MIKITSIIFFTTLLLSCKKEKISQESFIGNYSVYTISNPFPLFVIEKGNLEDELQMDDLDIYADISPLKTIARIISPTEFVIPDHVYAHHANSSGQGCMICPVYSPYLVKYNGQAVLKPQESELSITVNTYHKFPQDENFVLIKQETMTLFKQ